MPRKRQTSADQQTHARKPTPTFLLELPLQVTPGRRSGCAPIWKPRASSITPSCPKGSGGSGACGLIPPGRQPVPFLAPRSWNGSAPLRRCAQQYGFSEYALHDAAKGLELCLDRRPRGCGAGADAGHARLSRPQPGVSGPGPPGALQEPGTGPLQRGEQAHQYRAALRAPASRAGQRRVSAVAGRPVACAHRLEGSGGDLRPGPSHQICPADSAPGQQRSRPGGRSSGPALLRATGAGGGPLPEAQTPGRQRHRWPGPGTLHDCHRARERAPHAWRCSAPSWLPMPRRSVVSSARWTGSAAPTTRSNYDERGRIKKRGKQRLTWKHSKRYLATRRRKATRERRLAAHRKSLHGRLVHEIVAVGTTIITEKISYRAWQKQFGKSVGLRAPGMFIDTVETHRCKHGRHPGRSFHAQHQTLAVLSWLRPVRARSRCGSAGISVPVASQPSATSTRRFWPPIWIQQIFFPRVPNRGTPPVGKVGSPACGQHTSKPFNARVRGSLCLAASVSPESERVCPKVQAEPHKSPPALKSDGKRGSKARNLQGFSPERSQSLYVASVITPSMPI